MDRDANAILEAQNGTRLPALVPLRAQLMASNPFAYLRGAAAVMAHDLKWQPMVGASVQACGDCHLMNFGAFATPEDNILFDINDFDETLPGVDFTVDLKRLAASIAVAAADLGLAAEKRHALAAGAVRAYRRRMDSLSYLTPLEIWHSRIDLESETRKFRNAALRRKIEVLIARARGRGLDRDEAPISPRPARPSSTTRRRASSTSRRIRTRPGVSTPKPTSRPTATCSRRRSALFWSATRCGISCSRRWASARSALIAMSAST